MKKKLKDKWVAALRSGEYEQGFRRLCRLKGSYDEFCGLGVLCDILVLEGEIPPPEKKFIDSLYYCGSSYSLNRTVLDQAGLTNGQQQALICLNDTDCRTFDEIADYIEAEVR